MFQKGKKKTGGRVKGKAAKTKQTVREILAANKIDLIQDIIDDLPELSPKDRVKTRMGLMPYVYPQLRNTEISGEIQHALSQPIVQITLPSNGREVSAKPVGERVQVPGAVSVPTIPSKT
jgi:hypothetical protein